VRRAIETQWILESSDTDILQECESWYIHERNPQWIRRNALIIMGNTAQPTDAWVHTALQSYTTSAEPVLRAQAIWAAARLGLTAYVPHHDADPVVADELLHLPTLRDDL
jgi:epoxyqueuosine reductase